MIFYRRFQLRNQARASTQTESTDADHKEFATNHRTIASHMHATRMCLWPQTRTFIYIGSRMCEYDDFEQKNTTLSDHDTTYIYVRMSIHIEKANTQTQWRSVHRHTCDGGRAVGLGHWRITVTSCGTCAIANTRPKCVFTNMSI